jgi:hypothetical protein
MSNAVIGALRVNLGLDSAEFQSGLGKAKTQLSGFQAAIGSLKGALGALGAALAVFGVGAAIRGALDLADSMGKAAQSIGIPVEELSRLKYAADLSGVSFETLSASMRRLSQEISEALAKPSSEAARTFQALQIELRNADGTMRGTSEIMTDLADRFSRMEDGAAKTALATQLFGRAGMEMIPMLNLGAQGLAGMKAEAEALGITITESAARASEEFNDNLSRMGELIRGVVTSAVNELADEFALMSNAMFQAAKDSGVFEYAAQGLIVALKALVSVALIAANGIKAAAMDIAFAAKVIGQAATLDWSGVTQTWSEGSGSQAVLKETEQILKNMWSGAEQIRQAAPGIGRQIAAPIDAAKIVMERSASQAGSAVARGASAARSAMSTLANDGARVFEATRTPAERLAAEIARLDGLLQSGAINWDTYNRAVASAQEKFNEAGTSGTNLAQSLSGQFSGMFEGMVSGSKTAQEAINQLLNSLGKMLINKAFTALFSGGGGSGGIFGSLGSIFGGFFADGGTIPAGKMAVVGERGPELIYSGGSARQVIPNDQIGGGGEVRVMVDVRPSGDFDTRVASTARGVAVETVRGYDSALPGRLSAIQKRAG